MTTDTKTVVGISYNKRLLVYLGCSMFFMINILQHYGLCIVQSVVEHPVLQ